MNRNFLRPLTSINNKLPDYKNRLSGKLSGMINNKHSSLALNSSVGSVQRHGYAIDALITKYELGDDFYTDLVEILNNIDFRLEQKKDKLIYGLNQLKKEVENM